jgi:hypothetical protein
VKSFCADNSIQRRLVDSHASRSNTPLQDDEDYRILDYTAAHAPHIPDHLIGILSDGLHSTVPIGYPNCSDGTVVDTEADAR